MRTNFDIYVFITEKEEYVLLIYLVVTSFIRVYVIKHPQSINTKSTFWDRSKRKTASIHNLQQQDK